MESINVNHIGNFHLLPKEVRSEMAAHTLSRSELDKDKEVLGYNSLGLLSLICQGYWTGNKFFAYSYSSRTCCWDSDIN